MHSKDPDLELWKRAQARDEEAFGLLRYRNAGVVRGTLKQCLSNTDATTLEELENGAWLAISSSLPQFRGDALFSTWIVTITKRQACAHVSVKIRERKVVEAASQECEREQAVDWESLLLDNIALKQALLKLSEQERTVISLHYLVGLTVEDVAQRSGIPHGTVKKRLKDGLAKLRLVLSPPDPETE